MERKMVRCTMMRFDGNEIRRLATRIVIDDNDNDSNDDTDAVAVAAIGSNVCMQCKLDKCVNAQRAIRCMYKRNV